MKIHPCIDVSEQTRARRMCWEQTDAVNQWATVHIGGAADEETEEGVIHLLSGALKEPQQASDTVNETMCVGKEKEFELTAEDIDAINEAVSNLSDTERQVNNLCSKLGLEDASAIAQREMEYVKLLTAFPIEMARNVKTVLEETEQKKQKCDSECSALATLLKITDMKLAHLAECEAAISKCQFPRFDDVTEYEELQAVNFMRKENVRQFKSVKALQTRFKKRIQELKEKLRKKEEIDNLCFRLGQTKKTLYTQIACLKNYATHAQEVHVPSAEE
jgi:hypothetical protein